MIIEVVHVRMLNLQLDRDGLQVGNIAMGKTRVKLTNSQDKTSNTVRHQTRQNRNAVNARSLWPLEHISSFPLGRASKQWVDDSSRNARPPGSDTACKESVPCIQVLPFAILGVFELLDDNSPRCLVLVTRPAREEPGIGDAAGSSQAN